MPNYPYKNFNSMSHPLPVTESQKINVNVLAGGVREGERDEEKEDEREANFALQFQNVSVLTCGMEDTALVNEIKCKVLVVYRRERET